MIDRNHRLALTKQAALLGVCRGSVYYEPAPVSDADLALMRRLDELHLEFPFAGSRMLRGLLAAEGSKVGCEAAPKRDPSQNCRKQLKSPEKTPDVRGPDRRRSVPHRATILNGSS